MTTKPVFSNEEEKAKWFLGRYDVDPATGVCTYTKGGQVWHCKGWHVEGAGYQVLRVRGREFSEASVGLRGKAWVVRIYAHRLVFFAAHGYLPEEVDHINNDRLDNRIENLRAASDTGTARNRKLNSDNKSGFKGVRKIKGKYVAFIRHGPKVTRLGTFTAPEEAALAYDTAAALIHGEFAKTNAMLGLLP